MENNYTKVLIANSEALPETEDEYDGKDEIIENAEEKADLVYFLESIGSDNFEYIYSNLINTIRNIEVKTQIGFCYNIIDKIKEVYNFEFLRKIDLFSQSDCEEVYKLIAFLEFDNVDFFTNLLFGIVENLRNELIRIVIDKNWIQIEGRMLKEQLSWLIVLFLRTNNKSDLIDFFVSKINQRKMIITMKLYERRIANGESTN